MRVPQADNRSDIYQLCLRAVIVEEGLFYEDLVDILATQVDDQWALATIERRRRRNISETDRQAVASGKRYVARAIIDRAHRYGRITFLDRTDGRNTPRTVWKGDPPKGGGPAGRLRTWEDEREATETVAGLLHTARLVLG